MKQRIQMKQIKKKIKKAYKKRIKGHIFLLKNENTKKKSKVISILACFDFSPCKLFYETCLAIKKTPKTYAHAHLRNNC